MLCRVPMISTDGGCAADARVCPAQVKKRFPDTETRLLIGCSDGKKYSIDALQALDEEGYTNMVGLRVSYLPSPPMAPQHVTRPALLAHDAHRADALDSARCRGPLCTVCFSKVLYTAMLPDCSMI